MSKIATKAELESAIEHIKEMEDAIDEFLTDQFSELEIGLDSIEVKDNLNVFSIFDRVSDRAKEINNDLKKLRKVLRRMSRDVEVIIPVNDDEDDPIFTEEDIKKVMEAIK